MVLFCRGREYILILALKENYISYFHIFNYALMYLLLSCFSVCAFSVMIQNFIIYSLGADVNGFRGRRHSINLQKPASESYSIIDLHYSRSMSLDPDPLITDDPLTTILDLYLAAGVKLNTTCWGPCLFYG
jgi:hypothetical protein